MESKQSNSLREKDRAFGIALIINSSLDQLVDLPGSSDSGQFSRWAWNSITAGRASSYGTVSICPCEGFVRFLVANRKAASYPLRVPREGGPRVDSFGLLLKAKPTPHSFMEIDIIGPLGCPFNWRNVWSVSVPYYLPIHADTAKPCLICLIFFKIRGSLILYKIKYFLLK